MESNFFSLKSPLIQKEDAGNDVDLELGRPKKTMIETEPSQSTSFKFRHLNGFGTLKDSPRGSSSVSTRNFLAEENKHFPLKLERNHSLDAQDIQRVKSRTVNVLETRAKYLDQISFEDQQLYSDNDSVIKFEQLNRRNFQCMDILRPFFVLLYYCFCCCIVAMFRTPQNDGERNFIRDFQKTLKTLKRKRFVDSEVFNALIQLYRHKQSAYRTLTRVRLNPELTAKTGVRVDLEFFIPQLCSFYLNNELSEDEEQYIADILLKASQVDFFFAHRVLFFFQATLPYLNDMSLQYHKAHEILTKLKEIAENGSLKKNERIGQSNLYQEQLYLANSDVYLEALYQTDRRHLVSAECSFRKREPRQNFTHKDCLKVYIKKLMTDRISQKTNRNKPKSTSPPKWSYKKDASSIVLNPFEKPKELEEESKQKTEPVERNYALKAFLSTPHFVKTLTDLSVKILGETEKKQSLIIGLTQINKRLPASVYLPFFNEQWRNYCVLNICVSESKLFLTKSRAPYLVCVEVFQPEEILVTAQQYFAEDDNLLRSSQTKEKLLAEELAKLKNRSFEQLSQGLLIRNYFQENDLEIPQLENFNRNRFQSNDDDQMEEKKSPFAEETPNRQMSVDDFSLFAVKKASGSAIAPKEREDSETASLSAFYTRKHARKPQTDMLIDTESDQSPDPIPVVSQNSQSRLEFISKVERNFLFEELSDAQDRRVRESSPYGNLKTWRLARFIIKSGDDLRLEQFAMQLISLIDTIFKRKNLKLWLYPYEILATSADCGLIEFVKDGLSIDYIRKEMSALTTSPCNLLDYFRKNFGPVSSVSFKKAQDAFADSLAGYSLICYILQIKDRHNANIILDAEGHLVHIDFGFMLTFAPGKGLHFETAPFKLTNEFMAVLGGITGRGFKRFRENMVKGFEALSKHSTKLILLVQMVATSQPELSCFARGGRVAIDELRERICPSGEKLPKADIVDGLIRLSMDNWRTQIYDNYQFCCQGIF